MTSFVASARAAELSAPLRQLLDDSNHPLMERNGRAAVWVYFETRELTKAERQLALARAESELGARAAARRAKTFEPGRRLVDRHDLPLDAERLARASLSGAELRKQSRWLNAASFDATPAQIYALAALSFVRRVDLVRESAPMRLGVTKPRAEQAEGRPRSAAKKWTLDYGPSLASLELINVPPVHELGYTGNGVLLAMLDTGFHMAHESLDHVPVIAAYDAVDDDGSVDTEPGDPPTTHEHGTSVASTAIGYAPGSLIGPAYGASTLLVRAEDADMLDPVEEDYWVAGLEWAEAQGADLVSSSLGFVSWYAFSDLDGDTAAATVAADRAAARGLLIVNGAGNQGGLAFDHVISPADADSVLAVGATDVNGLFASFSSSGPTYDGRIKPDVAAQGALVNVADPNDDMGYTLSGGTSFSGPFVAAVAALVLERAPFLTPMQVREALRQTASQSATPDNQYGWGVVDALAALLYWGPQLVHDELPDSENFVGPYTVLASLSDAFPLDAQTPWLHYRLNSGAWQDVLMIDQGGGSYRANIPGQADGTTVEYYLEASDVQGLSARLPISAPSELFSFLVWEDLVAPVVTHSPLLDQDLGNWPPYVAAQVSDDLGVESVELRFSVNGGMEQGPFPLPSGANDLFGLPFPLSAGNLSAGDVISYTLTAVDAAAAANTTVEGPFQFTVLSGGGQVLIYDDTAGSGQATNVAAWLTTAGYSTVVVDMFAYQPGDLVDKLAVVLVSGDNEFPLDLLAFRQLIEGWVAGGGRLLIEGGEVGYAMKVVPRDASFARDVLHITAWGGDEEGSLVPATAQEGHSLLHQPSEINTPLALNYVAPGDQDAVSPDAASVVVLENTGSPAQAGVLLFDDQPIDPAVQIVYFAFALSALDDQSQAEALVINAMGRLLTSEPLTPVDELPQTRTWLLSAAPSPFNARTSLRMELAEDAPVVLEIYDLRGRLIRTLLDGSETLPAGHHERSWDGRDRFGQAVASGTYLTRMRAKETVRTGKVVLVK